MKYALLTFLFCLLATMILAQVIRPDGTIRLVSERRVDLSQRKYVLYAQGECIISPAISHGGGGR